MREKRNEEWKVATFEEVVADLNNAVKELQERSMKIPSSNRRFPKYFVNGRFKSVDEMTYQELYDKMDELLKES